MKRRDVFATLFRRNGRASGRRDPLPPPVAEPTARRDVAETSAVGEAETAAVPRVAVIAARFCLAMPPGFCRTCVERCPVPGALRVVQGMPRVDADICTGCGICHEVCPAPRKAALMLERKPATRAAHAC